MTDADVRAWLENDDLFREQLAAGHLHACQVGDVLSAQGIAVTVAPMEFRKTQADAHHWTEGDVDLRANGKPIEVKSTFVAFDAISAWPWPHAFVDTVDGWESKVTVPVATVVVSQVTQAMFVIPTSTKRDWRVVKTFDRVRRIPLRTYACPKRLLRPLNEFVAWLQRRPATT